MATALRLFRCSRVSCSQDVIGFTGRSLRPVKSSPQHCLFARKSNFSSTAWNAVKKGKKTATPNPVYRAPVKSSQVKEYQSSRSTLPSVLAELANRASPTLLYEGATPRLYILGCYAIGSFCLSYTVFHVYATILYTLPDTPKFVPYAMAGVCLIMTGFAVYMFLGVYRIVRSITVLPTPVGQPLQVRLESCPVLPFLTPRPVTIPYSSLTSSRPFYDQTDIPRPLTRAEKLAQYEAKQRDIEYNRSHILTLPFRQLSYHTGRGLRAARRFWTREDVVYVRCDGYNMTWKMDKTAAWALNDGRTLDKVVRPG